MTDRELLELAQSDEGGGWQAVDYAIREKLLAFGRLILKKSPRIKLRDLQNLLQHEKEHHEASIHPYDDAGSGD